MKKIMFVLLGLSSMLFANIYDKCATCHGLEGEKMALGKSKIIKDMTKEDFISSMKGYQDGTYGGPMKGVMTSQVKNLNKKDIEDLANLIIK